MKRKDPIRPIAREADLVVQEVDGEVLVYDLNTNKASCLNETAAAVWRQCNGERNVSEIAASFGADAACDDVVWLAIDQLQATKLLDVAPKIPSRFAAMSRRELAKRVGLTSMIALPLIATLVAPRAVHANSACVVGGTCTCTANSGNMQGQICTALVACTDVNCRCAWENNGNMNGTCVP